MPAPEKEPRKSEPSSAKGKVKFAERKRVLKHGSDGDVVRAFARKKG